MKSCRAAPFWEVMTAIFLAGKGFFRSSSNSPSSKLEVIQALEIAQSVLHDVLHAVDTGS